MNDEVSIPNLLALERGAYLTVEGPKALPVNWLDHQWRARDRFQNARNDMRADMNGSIPLRHYASEVK